MRQWLFLLISFIIIVLFVPVSKYRELNNIKIIDKIRVECINNEYLVTMYEIIPKREENGISYSHKKYYMSGDSLLIIKKKINKKYKGTIYFKSIKKIDSNCISVKSIKKSFI